MISGINGVAKVGPWGACPPIEMLSHIAKK